MPRLCFTCHPDDFEKYFEKICKDLFSIYDCAVYYSEDITEAVTRNQKDTLLFLNNFFIVPVTRKLLTTPNCAMDEDIPYAKKKHIPILPIVMGTDIEELYSQPENFGEIEYLKRYNCSTNNLPFEERLEKLLDAVLIDVEINRYINAANAAYIMSNFDEAIMHYEHIYSLRNKLLGEKNPETTSALSTIAHLNHLIGDNEKTLAFNKRRFEILCKALGKKHLETIKALNDVSGSFLILDDKENALETLKTVYDISCDVLGEEHTDTISALNGIAYLSFQINNKKDALKYYKKLYPISKKIHGENHKLTESAQRAIAVIPEMLDEE